MRIRSHSWGRANLSWSYVMEGLLHGCEQLGHEIVFISTNGTGGMRRWNEGRAAAAVAREQEMIAAAAPFDLDITFTIPPNFPKRFLANSRVRAAAYAYESSLMPAKWTPFYDMVDVMLPCSNYVAEMMLRNGCPLEKIRVLPYGVDTTLFNPDCPPVALPTQKAFKFLCVAAPHYRKQLDRLLEVYCQRFTAQDDVALLIKTTLFKKEDPRKTYEIDLKAVFAQLSQKYGSQMPEVRFLYGHMANMGSLYTACDAFVLMTASEGFGMPFLEALACELPVVAPRHGGQIDFLNDNNALLGDAGTRLAREQEQYWGGQAGAITGNPNEEHFGDLMIRIYKNYSGEKNRLLPHMRGTVSKLSWTNIATQLVQIVEDKTPAVAG